MTKLTPRAYSQSAIRFWSRKDMSQPPAPNVSDIVRLCPVWLAALRISLTARALPNWAWVSVWKSFMRMSIPGMWEYAAKARLSGLTTGRGHSCSQ